MKTRLKVIIAYAGFVGILAGLVGCQSPEVSRVAQITIQADKVSLQAAKLELSVKTDKVTTFVLSSVTPVILTQPLTQFVDAGGSFNLTAVAVGPDPFTEEPLTYQWQINGSNIVGATDYNYSVTNAQSADVATYTVVVKGSTAMGFGETNSAPAHVSLIYTNVLSGNGGTVESPIGLFTTSGTCSGTSFDKYHVFVPFDGPNITPPLVPSATWPNPSNLPKLTIDTFVSSNGATLDTAVQIAQNWGLFTTLCCNNDSAPPAPLTNPKLRK